MPPCLFYGKQCNKFLSLGRNQSTTYIVTWKSRQTLYCTQRAQDVHPAHQYSAHLRLASSLRLSWHKRRTSPWARLCVCATITCSLSSTLPALWPLSEGQYVRCPFQDTQWASIHKLVVDRENEKKKKRSVLSVSDTTISPSFPLMCRSRAGCTASAHILLQLLDPLSAALL